MTEGNRPDPLRDLDGRLREARRAADPDRGKRSDDTRSGIGYAFRIGVELVSALIVGVGIGILLDTWLGTAPWLMVVFFVLGAAAGMLNIYRVMSGMGRTKSGTDDGAPPSADS